jgi:hypothetical protein
MKDSTSDVVRILVMRVSGVKHRGFSHRSHSAPLLKIFCFVWLRGVNHSRQLFNLQIPQGSEIPLSEIPLPEISA